MKAKIIHLLNSTNRGGVQNLIRYMEDSDFFVSPASTRFHGSHPGGLARHSLNVYIELKILADKLNLQIPKDSLIITGLLHDLCKAGAYLPSGCPYIYNPSHPKGHSLLSLERIKQHIKLTEQEEMMIKYHMGLYGSIEFSSLYAEYSLKELVDVTNAHPECKVMYFCDDLATLKEKQNESKTDDNGSRHEVTRLS